MKFIVRQDTPQGQLYVIEISKAGALVLGERREAVKFPTQEDALSAIERATSSQTGCEVVEVQEYHPMHANSPLGHILLAMEGGATSIKEIREAVPPLVAQNLTDEDIIELVNRIPTLLIEWPASVDYFLLGEHIRIDHKGGPKHSHLDSEDRNWFEVSKQPPFQHDHNKELFEIGREVRYMAQTKEKTKAGGKAKGNGRVKAEKVLRDCHCGCGGQTFANFVVGHDARAYGLLRKEAKGEDVKLPKILTENKELLASMRGKVH